MSKSKGKGIFTRIVFIKEKRSLTIHFNFEVPSNFEVSRINWPIDEKEGNTDLPPKIKKEGKEGENRKKDGGVGGGGGGGGGGGKEGTKR